MPPKRAASPATMSRSPSRGKSPGKGGKGGKKKIAPPPKYEVYAERTIWSPRFKGWIKFVVKKPRLPKPADGQSWVDNFTGRPATLSHLSGEFVASTTRSLVTFADQFDSTKNLQDLMILYGPPGSGKSVLAQVFIQELLTRMELPFTIFQKWCLYIDARKFNNNNYHEMWKLVKEFMDAPQDKSIKVPLKVCLIDDCDTIPATHQNTLKTIMDKNSLKLKWIFTACEPRKFIQYLQTKGMQLKCKNPTDKEALLIVLNICYKFKIGYEREGIKAIFDLTRDDGMLSLSKIVNLLQTTFVNTSYISEENVFKAAKKRLPQAVVSPTAPIEPFKRCKICTLYPPCAHLPMETLISRGQQQRAAYPEYLGEKRAVCAEFVRTGRCTVFNLHKRCTLAHPKKLSRVLLPVIRCPTCTITWPCQHCSYSRGRNDLIETIADVERRIELIKTINVPEPPVHLIVHLVDAYEDWEMTISAIAKFYINSDKLAILNEAKSWIDTEYCVNQEEYDWKRTHVHRTFGELLTTPMLKEKRSASAAARGRSRNGRTRGGDSGIDDESSIGGGSIASGSVARSITSNAKSEGSVSKRGNDDNK